MNGLMDSNSLDGTLLEKTDAANPCGLIAKYAFSDTFQLWRGDTRVEIDENNIAHSVDINSKFKYVNDDEDEAKAKQWRNVTDGKTLLSSHRAPDGLVPDGVLPQFHKTLGPHH